MSQVVVTHLLDGTISLNVHNQMGHQGIQWTLGLLTQRWFWGGMYEDAEELVR